MDESVSRREGLRLRRRSLLCAERGRTRRELWGERSHRRPPASGGPVRDVLAPAPAGRAISDPDRFLRFPECLYLIWF